RRSCGSPSASKLLRCAPSHNRRGKQTPCTRARYERARALMFGSPSVRAAAVSALLVVALGTNARAQLSLRPRQGRFWVTAGGAIGAGALLDESARTFWLDRHSSFASSLADAGNFAGTGRNIIAGLAVTYLVTRLTHHRRAADAVLRISAGYAVSNVIVGVLKPVVGRHRPDSTNDAWRFKPFSNEDTLHSL